MSTKRIKKLPRGWVTSAGMAKALEVPTRSLLRGAREGRIAADAFRKDETTGRYTFKKQTVLDTWYLNMDAKHVKTPKGGKTKEEIAAIQDAAPGAQVQMSALSLSGTSDQILDDLRAKLDSMTGTDIRNAAEAIKVVKGEIEIAQLRNDLVRRDEVYGELFNYGQRVRHRLEAIPVRIVDEILACDDRVEAMTLMQDAIDEALSELTQIPSSLKPD